MTRLRARLFLAPVLALSATAALSAGSVASSYEVAPSGGPLAQGNYRIAETRIQTRLDLNAGQTPENLTVEPDGSTDVSFAKSRQVARIAQDGSVRVLATLPRPAGGDHAPGTGFPATTGITRAADGTLYFNYSAGDAGLTGLWRLRPGKTAERIVALTADSLPNGLVIDERSGQAYISDSKLKTVWRAPLAGGTAQKWATDQLLAPVSSFGANGLKLHNGALWVSNFDQGLLVRIPITSYGAAGALAVRARDLPGIDDFAFTGIGDELLATLNPANQVDLVREDGFHTAVLTSVDGLQNPAAIALQGRNIYVANAAFSTNKNPNVLLGRLVSGTGGTYSIGTGLSPRERANAEATIAVFDGLLNQHTVRATVERYLDARSFSQHNPDGPDGRDAVITTLEPVVKQFPDASLDITRIVTQGNLVVTQGLFKLNPEDRGTVEEDTLRFDDAGKVVEHWDVKQAVAETSANGHPQV
ncbi:nuclear transport factor 2 family protein [Amycolatopsis sp. NPDC051061]|uniref:nuclear transport factor 2 family protein n=1 Tax=Amycolatopsis sp. NPDC051061 TaxID=3155042 RepID=UPI003420B3D3